MPYHQHHHVLASELLQRLNNQDDNRGNFWTLSSTVVTRGILTLCSYLDDLGAWEWPYWKIAATFTLVLAVIRVTCRKQWGVDWYALVHAWISFTGCAAVVYLDLTASQQLTGMAEPLRSLHCHAPLTCLHRILPACTMGYSVLDLFDGLFISVDFFLHGAATMLVLAYYCAVGAPHIVEPLLIVEASTIFLVLVRAEFFNDTASMINQALFVSSFFVSRCLLSPWLHFRVLKIMWYQDEWRSCYPGHFLYFSIVSGLFYHCLNYYWMYKIVRKVRRKMQGKEGIRANNDIYDSNHHHENGTTFENGDLKKKAA